MPCIEVTEDDFDDMHHALGRPVDPMGKTYRNFYCVEAGSAKARHFEELGMWDRITRINGGKDVTYRVNEDGKSMLADWLSLKRRAAGSRDLGEPREGEAQPNAADQTPNPEANQ